jgi:hypothetical protein
MPTYTTKLNLPRPIGTDNFTLVNFQAFVDAIEAGAQKEIIKSDTAPVNPKIDDLWIDTSVTPHKLKRYNGSSWVEIGATPPVTSVNGKTGAVTLTASDVNAASSDSFASHLADNTKHITSEERTAWNAAQAKANDIEILYWMGAI